MAALDDAPHPISDAMLLAAVEEEERLLYPIESLASGSFRPTPLAQAPVLRLSFQRIAKLENLGGLAALRELRLDNNRIERIEGLDHLQNLTWLDLSFNRITKIEGLTALSQLTDLTLYGNKIRQLEGLSACAKLECLSLGNNEVASLSAIHALRPLKSLRVLNLDGNPICSHDEYRHNCLAFLTQLRYLDYELIRPEEVAAARETGVPVEELQSVEEGDRAAAAAAEAARATEAERAAFRAVGLGPCTSLFDDFFGGDSDWRRLAPVPALKDVHEALRVRVQELQSDCIAAVRSKTERIDREKGFFQRAVDAVLRGAEKDAVDALTKFHKQFKHMAREAATEAEVERMAVLHAQVDAMTQRVVVIEQDAAGRLMELIDVFESAMREERESMMQTHQIFLRAVEAADKEFGDQALAAVDAFVTSVKADDSLVAELDDELQIIFKDREHALGLVRSVLDTHLRCVNDAEDATKQFELERCDEVAKRARQVEVQRNRRRLAEIMAAREHLHARVDEEIEYALDRVRNQDHDDVTEEVSARVTSRTGP